MECSVTLYIHQLHFHFIFLSFIHIFFFFLFKGDRITVHCDLKGFIYESLLPRADQEHLKPPNRMNRKMTENYNELEDEEDEMESTEVLVEVTSNPHNGENLTTNHHINSYNSSLMNKKQNNYEFRLLNILQGKLEKDESSLYNDLWDISSYHCRGEGLTGRITHWSALAAPSCRGKWLRLTLDSPKLCTQAQFMFV